VHTGRILVVVSTVGSHRPATRADAAASVTGRRSRPWRVPAGGYFMLGDSRGDSCDSRTWGTVPRPNLVGPVILTYWRPLRINW
jgi:signal peptidase I